MGLLTFRNGQPTLAVGCGTARHRRAQFRFGSITKTFTALTLMRLAQQQNLSLDTPVRKLLRPLPYHNPWASTAPLRMRHLLELTAGLPDLAAAEWDSATPLTLAEAFALAPASRTMLWPPGLQHSYTNSAAGIAQAVIETVGAKPYADQLEALVLGPLHMNSASIEPNATLTGGFRADGLTPIPYWHMTYPAFGSLNATLGDMQRFLRWLLDQGRDWHRPRSAPQATTPDPLGFNADQRAQLFESHSSAASRAGLHTDYAAGIYSRTGAGVLWYGHGGDADGYRSRYGIDPISGNGYLIVINTDNPGLLRGLVRQLESALAPAASDARDAALQTMPSVADWDPSSVAGIYYPTSARFAVEPWRQGTARRIEVSVRNRQVWLQHGLTANSRRERLIPQQVQPGGSVLVGRPNDPAATAIFIRGAVETPDSLLLQGTFGNYVRLEPDRCPAIFPFCDSQ